MSENEELLTSKEIRIVKDDKTEKAELQAALTDKNKSALQKYQELAIGSSSLIALVKYEFFN